VHRANVELGVREGDMVEILSGLSPNERIVGSGAAFLQDGDIVQPLEQPAAPSAVAPIPNAPAQAPAPAANGNDSSEIRGREG
jgi:multidrug efflux pump subunit AcrA (membrane-fusion protein)